MQTRRLGNSGLELTTVGLGTWAIGGGDWPFGWGTQDDREAIEAIKKAMQLGINWIDTAHIYGFGESERLVGRALRELGPAQRPLVATKCGRLPQPDRTIGKVLKRDSIRQEVEGSLQRLGLEWIDLYQLHWPEPDEDIEEGWTTLKELVDEGKVRHIGVCNFNVEQLRRIQPIHPIASLQPQYNLLVRDVEDEVLPFCAQHDIGVVAYSPMYKGLLTGAFNQTRAASLPADDHRARDPRFQPPQLDIHLQLVEGLRTIADRRGRTLAELAIAWTLCRPEVTSAIVGARRPAQIEATAPAGDWQLDSEDQAEITELLADHQRRLR